MKIEDLNDEQWLEYVKTSHEYLECMFGRNLQSPETFEHLMRIFRKRFATWTPKKLTGCIKHGAEGRCGKFDYCNGHAISIWTLKSTDVYYR